jgi:hypothetical protein
MSTKLRNTMKRILLASLLLSAPLAHAEPAARELGDIHWGRNLEQGLAMSQQSGKPVLILFQEVPGCSTCVNYGSRVLSHPLIVDAAETLFVPVAVFNNRGGEDARALKSFREPAWNNPVVRIVDSNRRNLASRVAGNYSEQGLVEAMVNALRASRREVPHYLQLLHHELSAAQRGTDKAVFAMACFWSGEGKLGELPGVVATRPGFLHHEEVVEVSYDPRALSYADLVKQASKLGCTRKVFARTRAQERTASKLVGGNARLSTEPVRPDREFKFYLRQEAIRYLPLTETQAARVNAAAGRRQDLTPHLSPSQLALYHIIRRHPRAAWPMAIDNPDFRQAWQAAQHVASQVNHRPGVTLDIHAAH